MKFERNPLPLLEGDLEIWIRSDELRTLIHDNHNNCIDTEKLKLPTTVDEYGVLVQEIFTHKKIIDLVKLRRFYERELKQC